MSVASPASAHSASGVEEQSSGAPEPRVEAKNRAIRPWFRSSPWAAAAVAAGAIALAPAFWSLGVRFWETTYYQHVPLYLAALGALAWWRCRGWRESVTAPGRGAVAWLLWGFALLAAVPAVLLGSPLGGGIGALLALLAAAYTYGGPTLVGRVAPCWAAAWLALPLPLKLDQRLVVAMQALATDWASAGLDLLGDRHLVAGTTVEMPGRSFFVEEACSGVNSLFATLAGVTLYLVWNRRGFIRSLIVLAAGVFWVLLANAVRVTAVVVLVDRYDLPVQEGLGHELLGACTFAAAVGLTLSFDRLLLFVAPAHRFSLGRLAALWRPATEQSAADVYGEYRASVAPVAFPRRSVLWSLVTAAFIVAAVGQFVLPGRNVVAAPVVVDPSLLKDIPKDALPEEWNGWQLVAHDTVTRSREDRMGARSRIWAYRKGSVTAAISMDGPFAEGWHDLKVCYTAAGWNCSDVIDVKPERSPGESREPGDVITRMRMRKPDGRYGLVRFASHAIDDDAPIGPSRSDRVALLSRFSGSIGEVWDGLMEDAGQQAEREPAYQVQLLVDSYLPLDDDSREDVDRLYEEMRNRLTSWEPAAG